jgi:hypothetical protein
MIILIETVAIGRMINYASTFPLTLYWTVEDHISTYYTKTIFNLPIEDFEI